MGFSGLDSSHRLEALHARAESRRRSLLEESLIRRELGEGLSPSLLSGLAGLAARAFRSLARLVA